MNLKTKVAIGLAKIPVISSWTERWTAPVIELYLNELQHDILRKKWQQAELEKFTDDLKAGRVEGRSAAVRYRDIERRYER